MSSQKFTIQTDDAPAAIGPYSQAVRAGDTLYTSGQIALDPVTGQLVAGGIREQTMRVLANLEAILVAAETEASHVVKTTIFLKNMADFAVVNELYGEFFAPSEVVAPARSTVAVAELPKGALVEIEAIVKL
jgi:2-iminobutanoate/2-iminopropanoate deaminase